MEGFPNHIVSDLSTPTKLGFGALEFRGLGFRVGGLCRAKRHFAQDVVKALWICTGSSRKVFVYLEPLY